MHRSIGSSGHHGVVKPMARKPKTSTDIFKLKIGQFLENLVRGEPVGKQIQDIGNPDPHPPDAGTATTLLRINSDTFSQIGHSLSLQFLFSFMH